jgi:hypothetical protein
MNRTRAALVGAVGGIVGLVTFLIARKHYEAPSLRPMRLAMIGDSLAVGLGPQIQKLADKAGIPFKYEGHVGTTPKQWATHAPDCGQCGDWLASFEPTHVLVVLGTNDIGYSKPPPSYYATIRDRIVALGATVVWVDPPSMPNDRLAAVRATIAALGVPVIPPAQIAISSDNIHPTSSGYVDWAGQIWHEVPA